VRRPSGNPDADGDLVHRFSDSPGAPRERTFQLVLHGSAGALGGAAASDAAGSSCPLSI